MSDAKGRLVVADISGGRNGIDPPTSPRFRDNQCLDAVNVDFFHATCGNKRNGMSTSGVSFSSGGPFTGKISNLARHVPSTDDTLAEEWAVDDAATPVVGRKAAATTFTAPTLKDNFTGNAWDLSFATLNGKLFIAGKTAQSRLHCWDGSTVRRAGINQGANAPTVANTGVGAYAATLRYYRVRFTIQATGVTTNRSEATTSVSFTPAGTGTAARVTQPAVPNEGETHWEVEASIDNISFFVLSAVVIGTTTYDDSAVTTTYPNNTLSPSTGVYTLQKSYKYIAADQNRLLGFGSYTTTDKQNTVEISAIVGSLNISDAERVDTTGGYTVALDETDSGFATALYGPVFGNFYAGKDHQLWELTRTGSTTKPYKEFPISKSIGVVFHKAICVGEDAQGRAALYHMSHRGVYRYGAGGHEYIGEGIEDYVLGPTATINLKATKVIAHCVYHADKRQVYVWWATGSSNDPNQAAIYDVRSGGWSLVLTGDKLANARCSMLFANTIAASMSKDLKPYLGSALVANTIYKADDSAATDDAGTAFQAYVDLKPLEPGGPGFNGEVGDSWLLAKTGSGVTITATVTPDFDAALATTGTCTLTAVGTETRVSKRLEGSALTSRTGFIQIRIGDSAAVSNAWTLDRVVIPYVRKEALAG